MQKLVGGTNFGYDGVYGNQGNTDNNYYNHYTKKAQGYVYYRNAHLENDELMNLLKN